MEIRLRVERQEPDVGAETLGPFLRLGFPHYCGLAPGPGSMTAYGQFIEAEYLPNPKVATANETQS